MLRKFSRACVCVLAFAASVNFAQGGTHGFTVLYSLCSQANCSDGAYPFAGLIADTSGNFYGTASEGGANGGGTVFEIAAGGTETVLYSFCAQANCTDGSTPYGGVVIDTSGNLYGTTFGGGANGQGTVFKITPGGTETVLHSFGSSGDGQQPWARPLLKRSKLYGTTEAGGANGGGTVFVVSTSGGEHVLHSFCSMANCADGANPYDNLLL